jgi:hypothetical protein
MASATPAAAPPAARPASRWIVGRGVDLSLVIGGSGAGYLYLLLYAALHVPISYLWWVWSIGLDGTHIFATASRTFFDREMRARNRRMLAASVIVFFSLGPVLVLTAGKQCLALLVGIWAYYHVVRQHYGFMVLYKVKNRDLRPLDNALDRLFLGVMLIAPPFHRFFIRRPQDLGLPRGIPHAAGPLWLVVGATAALWLGRQAVRFRGGDPVVNLPKYLLLGALVPLHWLVFVYMNWMAAVPTVTIVHNLQYHAIVWFHNRNRYGAPDAAATHGRVPASVAHSLLAYAALALAFSVLYRVPGFQLGKISDLAFGLFCGFGLTHYYLDSRIWRVRHDPGLRAALRLV